MCTLEGRKDQGGMICNIPRITWVILNSSQSTSVLWNVEKGYKGSNKCIKNTEGHSGQMFHFVVNTRGVI